LRACCAVHDRDGHRLALHRLATPRPAQPRPAQPRKGIGPLDGELHQCPGRPESVDPLRGSCASRLGCVATRALVALPTGTWTLATSTHFLPLTAVRPPRHPDHMIARNGRGASPFVNGHTWRGTTHRRCSVGPAPPPTRSSTPVASMCSRRSGRSRALADRLDECENLGREGPALCLIGLTDREARSDCGQGVGKDTLEAR